mmetsp:Transcript_55029/g.128128  ORF Transcript_55029/g.128128 Transcript_55029/m.128128 type:complete len:388 (+) Transcript_55029:59-1222(+)
MALSKAQGPAVPADANAGSASLPGTSLLGMGEWTGMVFDFVPLVSALGGRVRAPLEELWEDAMETVSDLKGVTLPREALTELAQATGAGSTHRALVVPVAISVLAAPQVHTAVVIAGVSFSTKFIYTFVSFIMAVASHSMSLRHPDEPDRTVQRRSALALGFCAGTHMLALIAQQLPSASLQLLLESMGIDLELLSGAKGLVFCHFLEDFVVQPILIMNLGYLSGQSPRRMIPCIAWSLLSTFCSSGACLTTTSPHGMILVLLGFSSLGLAAQAVGQLPGHAQSVHTVNKQRSQIAGDLLVFTWTLYPTVQALGFVGSLTPQQQLHLFALLDMLLKVGVCHIMLRARAALRNAARHFEQKQAAPSVAGSQEPCSEPDPREPEASVEA